MFVSVLFHLNTVKVKGYTMAYLGPSCGGGPIFFILLLSYNGHFYF